MFPIHFSSIDVLFCFHFSWNNPFMKVILTYAKKKQSIVNVIAIKCFIFKRILVFFP